MKDEWQASPRIQARMKELGVKDEHALQSYFIQRIGKFLNSKGRKLIGWDEILEGGLAPNATVMSWRGIDGAIAAAKAGHDTVLSPAPDLYFDHWQSPGDISPGRSNTLSLKMCTSSIRCRHRSRPSSANTSSVCRRISGRK